MSMQTIHIPSTNYASFPYQFGNREDYLNLGVPLYEAAVTCDWERAKIIFDKRPDLVRFGLSKDLGTALHVAVNAEYWISKKKNASFVKNLVDMMTVDDLELKNKHSNTAFWEAAAFGRIEVVKIMMGKNHNLLNIRGGGGGTFDDHGLLILPLCASASTGNAYTVRHLYDASQKMTGDYWTDTDRDFTLLHCVKNYLFDVAQQILKDRPELVQNVSLLEALAHKHQAYYKSPGFNLIRMIYRAARRVCGKEVLPIQYGRALELLKIIWGHATRAMDIDEIESMVRGGILFIAAERGNTEFVVELLRTYPHLMFDTNEDGLTIFHVAVMHRHIGIYNLLYEVGRSSRNKILVLKDKSDNNMSHLVGKTLKDMAAKTSRASLLLQRESLWFIEVSDMMVPYLRRERNKNGQTALELLVKESEDQVSKGLKWTKDCMVVATLIITVAFAAAFTVPGGYKGDNGLPFFIHQRSMLVFVIADAISLFSSSTSLLVLLSILTSPHQHEDFIYSLPNKLVLCLLTLLVSVAAMMVAFSASFFVLYHNGLKWVPILIAVSVTIPVIVFAMLQFPLLMDMFCSRYDHRYLFGPKKRMLYNSKQISLQGNRLLETTFSPRILATTCSTSVKLH